MNSYRWAQVMVIIAGLVYLFSGVALLAAPVWFFETIGNYPPFNRHYLGDVGSFLLPLGAGLLVAAKDLTKHRSLIIVAVAGSILHALNHLYDAILSRESVAHWLTDTIPLIALGLFLLFAVRALKEK